MSVAWQGVFPAATTQFQVDHSVDLPATMAHVGKMVDAGIHGLIMLGTVGENCSLLYEEKLEVLRETVRHVGGRLPILSGVAEYSTAPRVPVRGGRTEARCRRPDGFASDGIQV